jgi:Lrp/AsnC family transcriptional regulator for asnA, asnC and gidA
MANVHLDALDKKILQMIASDARVPFLEVARACNVSGAAIHQRIQKLTAQGVLKGSQFIIDPEKIGYEACAYVGLSLKNPDKFEEAVSKLKLIPEVTECHFTTGGYDLFIKLYARNNHQMLNLIHDMSKLLNLSRSETVVSFNAAFNRQLPVSEIPVDKENEEEDQ